MRKQNYQPGRQDRRADVFNIRYNFRALHNLERLTRRIEENEVLTVISAIIDYNNGGYTLIVDTVWAGSENFAYRYIWERQNLQIIANFEILEEKRLKL